MLDDVRAYMIGPKAENLDFFMELVEEALRGHLHWRRDFHPEDNQVVSSRDKAGQAFRDFQGQLRDVLAEFLDDAKRGVPFFSGRYIGHMNTDLLLPGLLGYFGAMLYNQNNVAGESSPRTAQLERDVISMLARMVGFGPSSYGYLTSGGTTANVYALWVARNLRSWPIALRLAISNALMTPGVPRHARQAAEVLRRLVIGLGRQGSSALDETSLVDLWNLPVSDVACRLREHAIDALVRSGDPTFATKLSAAQAVDELIGPWTTGYLGEIGFLDAVGAHFHDQAQYFRRPPIILVPKNTHYSLAKALDLLGLGRAVGDAGTLQELSLCDDFTIDPDRLRARLQLARNNGERVLSVVSVFGTTEEGALDDLDAVNTARAEAERAGLSVHMHVDACYGGYLASMFRTPDGVVANGYAVTAWLRDFARAFGIGDEEAERLIDRGSGWLSWHQLSQRVASLASADSISLDPHKLGYVPYPAGAILLRERSMREAVSYSAPYLWTGMDKSDAEFVGRYTLEGSRPGATAAACWLAHKAVPLTQAGHGKIIAGSMLATRDLCEALITRQKVVPSVKVALIAKPHVNMICYLPYHVDSESLDEIGAVGRLVAAELDPTKRNAFMAVSTTLDVYPTREWIHARFESKLAERLIKALPEDAGQPYKLPVLRSVVMGPLALGATTRGDENEPRRLVDVYAEHLARLTDAAFRSHRIDQARKAFGPHRPLLVVDDHPAVFGYLKAECESIDRHLVDHMRFANSIDNALRIIKEYDRPLHFAILDIDLQNDDADGYDLLEEICRRNDDERCDETCRIKSVIFFTVGGGHHEDKVKQITTRYRNVPHVPNLPFIKPGADGDKEQFREQFRRWLYEAAKTG